MKIYTVGYLGIHYCDYYAGSEAEAIEICRKENSSDKSLPQDVSDWWANEVPKAFHDVVKPKNAR